MPTDFRGRELYPITCSVCGKEDTVPFKPLQNKPLYCKECYRKVRQSTSFFDKED